MTPWEMLSFLSLGPSVCHKQVWITKSQKCNGYVFDIWKSCFKDKIFKRKAKGMSVLFEHNRVWDKFIINSYRDFACPDIWYSSSCFIFMIICFDRTIATWGTMFAKAPKAKHCVYILHQYVSTDGKEINSFLNHRLWKEAFNSFSKYKALHEWGNFCTIWKFGSVPSVLLSVSAIFAEK